MGSHRRVNGDAREARTPLPPGVAVDPGPPAGYGPGVPALGRSPPVPATPDDSDDVEKRLDLAVQDPANRKLSAVKVAAELGVDPELIRDRRNDTIKIRY